MLRYLQKIPSDVMLRYMAWHNVKNLDQILYFWVKCFQTVYTLSKLVDILEEALSLEQSEATTIKLI